MMSQRQQAQRSTNQGDVQAMSGQIRDLERTLQQTTQSQKRLLQQ
jgi:RNA polymerase-interacting CarD/CdnL/TRCF family regulator